MPEKLKIIPLGGLRGIGENITVYEYGGDIVVVDCGMGFPDGDTLGIDLVIPDITYLKMHKNRIRGIIITHGHEDHIGAIPYILKDINPPIYAPPFARGLIENKLKEAGLFETAKLHTISPGDVVALGHMTVEAINVNHSMPDAVSYAISTGLGTVIHTGDFKIDSTPVGGEMIDLARFGELGKQGVLALLADSTNAERPGIAMSERTVGESFDNVFRGCNQRLIFTTFASNLYRIQQIINSAVKYGRKVAISGRSIENILSIAINLGYVNIPVGTVVDMEQIKNCDNSKLTIITTGSQGETMSALYRMAFGTHRFVDIVPGDRVVMSASPIPGNEKTITKVINELMRRGAEVLYESLAQLHVSGHACREELKILYGLVRPKYFMPIHGEYKHLMANSQLMESMGVSPKNIFIGDNGRILEITAKSARLTSQVPAGQLMIDGSVIGDSDSVVFRDRRLIAEDGLIIVVLTLNSESGELLSGPDIITRGFVYGQNNPEFIAQLESIAREAYAGCRGNSYDWTSVKSAIRSKLSSFLSRTNHSRPMVLPVITEV